MGGSCTRSVNYQPQGVSLHAVWPLLQAAVYGSRDATLTPELFKHVLHMKLREHEQRKGFAAEQGQ